jgi:hypothetical protein
MGILKPTEELIRRTVATYLKPGFSCLEFGDQMVTHLNLPTVAAELYKSLGCGRYVSVDGNGRGTITFDLNRKAGELAALVKEPKFDLVTDIGTGEHIFDQAQFWRTLHTMTAVGGYILFDRPSQGYDGHCFWRTDYSTYFDIAEANGYRVIECERRRGRRNADGETYGELVSGVFRKLTGGKFKAPNQARYQKLLRPILK